MLNATARNGAGLSRDAKKRTDRTRTRTRARVRGDWRPSFLEAFVEHGTVLAACRKVGVGRSTVYDERRRNEDFAPVFADAEVEVTESLEGEAIRRALHGSDRLMEFLLKARRPEKYGERTRFNRGEVAERLVLTPEQEAEELAAFGMQAALEVAAGPEFVTPPPNA